MYLDSLYRSGSPTLSLEVFPPKKDSSVDTVYDTLRQISVLQPSFVSVTYGAGGSGNSGKTLEIASALKHQFSVEPLAHLTAITAKKETIARTLKELEQNDIQNIMALRGDIPVDFSGDPNGDFVYAKDLIAYIKRSGNFCVGAACYPEGHIDCEDPDQNLDHLLQKQQAGADFFISQLFFDNNLFFDFQDQALRKGVTRPIIAGIMPILSKSQVSRMIFTCGASLPSAIIRILHRYENDPQSLQQAGIDYVCTQMEGLMAQGVKHIHIYSMNKPQIAVACKTRFDGIVG